MTGQDTEWPAGLDGPLRVKPGTAVRLPDGFDPGDRLGLHKGEDGARLLRQGRELLTEYQRRLAAQDTYEVLMVLQAIDAGGKDGTIRHVMSGVNPQGVAVSSFKAPSAEELGHDYLWRHARVHPQDLNRERLPPQARGPGVWKRRYREINDWEHYLTGNGIAVVKLFLNVSKEEQRTRFLKRIDRPEKNWKFSAADARERRYWDDYQQAYSQMLSNTSTEWAPWHVLPADHKWLTRACAAAVIAAALIEIDPHYPVTDDAARAELGKAKAELEAEAPPGAPADPAAAKPRITKTED